MSLSRNRVLWLIALSGLPVLLVMTFLIMRPVVSDPEAGSGRSADLGWLPGPAGQLPMSHAGNAFHEVGPSSCLECHSGEHAAWKGSHHDRANRPIHLDSREDMAPFLTSQATYEKDGEYFRLYQSDDGFRLEVQDEAGTVTDYPIVGLLGVDPLVNFLVALPDGKIQATTLSWDVHRKELFDSFDGEERRSGDYGHWLGQGFNWNANCASCHNTGFHKNLNVETLEYRSEWFTQGVSCRQCHPGSEEHVRAVRSGGANVFPATLGIEQVMHNCFSCHSRRTELTKNRFQPGENYHDHFMLALPDQPGLYFPDGQIRDEVFAGASFQISAMGQAGVTCMDCHDPHSLGLKLPAMNNALCQQCHGSGVRDAPVIDPKAHAFHHPMSEGGRCIDCHMPTRVYMSRDPRHDHSFPIPDPFLTLELGVPNACNQCHQEESPEWAAEWVEDWYGEGFHERREPARVRARLLADVHRGEGDAKALLEYLGIEDNPAWRASLTGLLGHVEPAPEMLPYLRHAAADEEVLVREKAAGLMARLAPEDPVMDRLLADKRRSVRVAAVQSQPAMAAEFTPELQADRKEYLETNADRPQVAFVLAREALQAGDREEMVTYLHNATRLAPQEAEVWRQKAILHSDAGQPAQARRDFLHAISLEPENATMHWTYALFLAESDDLEGAVAAFRRTVSLDPEFPRGIYNLVVALANLHRWNEAREYLQATLDRQPDNSDLHQLAQWMHSVGQW